CTLCPFFSRLRPSPSAPLFPYTTLFRSGRVADGRVDVVALAREVDGGGQTDAAAGPGNQDHRHTRSFRVTRGGEAPPRWRGRSADRKSTRLNSSHVAISYAVFCLKKKNE